MVHKIRSFFVAAIALAASFISSSAHAATVTNAKWGNIGESSIPGVASNVAQGGYASFTLNFSANDNLTHKEIGADGTVKVKQITFVRRASGAQAQPTTVRLTQGNKTADGTVAYNSANIIIYGNQWPENPKSLWTRTGYYVATFTSDVEFDVSTDISLAFLDSNGQTGFNAGISMIQPNNSVLKNGAYSPAIEIIGDYTPSPSEVATVTVNTDEQQTWTWGTLHWDVTPTKALKAEIIVTGSKSLTIFPGDDTDAVAKSITFKGSSSVDYTATGLYNGGKITSEIPLQLTASIPIEVDTGANDLTYSCIGEISPAISTTGAFTKGGTGTLNIPDALNPASITVENGVAKFTANSAYGQSKLITVHAGGQVDCSPNGSKSQWKYEIAGFGPNNTGALIVRNTGSNGSCNVGDGNGAITLTANASINVPSGKTWFFVSPSYNNNTIELNNHTLSLVGAGAFSLSNTTVNNGTIEVKSGTLSKNSGRTWTFSNVNLILDGGTIDVSSALTAGALTYSSGSINTPNNLTVSTKVVCDGAAIPAAPAGDYSVEIKGTVVANSVLNNLEKTIKLVNGETETDVATLDCAGITLPLAGTITADSTGTIELPSGYKSGRIAKYAGETKPQDLEFMQGETSFTADVKVIDGYLVVEGPSATISTAECSWSELFAGKTIEPGVSVELTMAIAASTLTIPEGGVSLDNLTIKGGGALTIVGGNIRCTDIINPNGVTLTFNNDELNFYVPAGIVKTIDMVIAGTTKVNKTGEGKLILTGANTFSGGLVVTTGIVTRSGGNNARSAFGAANTTIDVKNGATIDWAETQKVNGNQYNLKIAGEGVDGYAFTTSVDSSLSGGQFYPITLELSGDATVGGAGETANRCGVMKYVGSAFVATTANLNGHTLTKKGNSEFALSKVVFSGNGKVVIDGGFLGFYNPGGEFADGISVEMNHAGKNLYLYNEAKFSELVSKNAQALADGTVIIGKSVKGAFTAKKITLDSGATVDVTDGIVTLSENVVTLGNSLTVVVGSSLDEGDSVKVFGGTFAYEVIDSVALTVKVGEQVQEGDYVLEKRNDGVYLVRLSPKAWIGETDTNWNTAANWSPASIPTANDDVIISKDANITVSGSPTARSIAIGGNVTLSGIANNGTVGNISIALNKQLTIDVGSGNTVNCTDVSGQGTLVKTGTGTLHANASTGRKAFDGGVAVLVNAGTVEIEGTAGIGSVAFTIADGANLDCYGWLAASGTWSISNDANVSVFNNSRGGNCAVISGSGAFTKLGAGELTFKSALGNSGNKYTGAVNVNEGTLTIAPRSTGDNFKSYVSGATIVRDGATLKTANNDATFDSGSNRLQSGGTLEIAGGTTKFKSGTNSNGLCGTLKIDRGATFENTVTDSLYYGGTMTVDVYGTLNMASTRWTVGGSNTINLYAGAVVQGAGQSSNGALDFNSDACKLKCLSNEGIDEAVNITCAIRLRSNLTIDVEDGVLAKLNCSAFNYDGSKRSVFKTGDGVLEVGCDITGGCNQFAVNAGTLKVATGAVLPDAVVASGTTLDISAIAGSDASSVFTSNLTMNDGMAVVFPAGYDTTQPFTLCAGTIVHDGDTIDIVVGGDSATATISDGNKITVTYTSTSWTGAAGDSLWGTAGNWTHGVPTEGMSAIIEAKSYVVIYVNGSYKVKDLHITGEPDPEFRKLVHLTDEGYDNSKIEVADHKIYTTSTLFMTASNPLLGDENTFFLDDDAHVYYSSGTTETTVKGIYGNGKFDANSSITLTPADDEVYAASGVTITADMLNISIKIAADAKLENVEFDFDRGNSATALGALTVDGALAVIGNGRLEVNGSINGTDTAISGDGTIVYNGALPGNEKTSYQNTENWTGTVWLKNITSSVGWVNINNFGHSGSKVAVTGFTSYFNVNVDYTPEFVLKDEGDVKAFVVGDGSSTNTTRFNKVSGSGTITTEGASSGTAVNLLFKEWSGYTGNITVDANKSVTFGDAQISGDDNGKIVIAVGKTLTMAGQTWVAGNGIVVNGTIGGAGTLGSNTTFGNDATIDASAAQLSVAANKTLTFGDTLTVKLASPPTVETPAVKILNGSFAESISDTALTVVVNDQEVQGDFRIKQDANGVWAIIYFDEFTWTGEGANRNWSNPANWSPAIVPLEGTDVTIDVGEATDYSIVIDSNTAALNSLTVTGAGVNFSGEGTINGPITLATPKIAGSLKAVGDVTVSAAGAVEVTGGMDITGNLTFDNHFETLTFKDNADVNVTGDMRTTEHSNAKVYFYDGEITVSGTLYTGADNNAYTRYYFGDADSSAMVITVNKLDANFNGRAFYNYDLASDATINVGEGGFIMYGRGDNPPLFNFVGGKYVATTTSTFGGADNLRYVVTADSTIEVVDGATLTINNSGKDFGQAGKKITKTGLGTLKFAGKVLTAIDVTAGTVEMTAGDEAGVTVTAGAGLRLKVSDAQWIAGYTSPATIPEDTNITFILPTGDEVTGDHNRLPSKAVDKTWVGGETGNWDVDDNWNPSGVPSTGHSVAIDSPVAITIPTDGATIGGITFKGDGAITLTGGAINSGVIVKVGAGRAEIAGTATVSGAISVIEGTLAIDFAEDYSQAISVDGVLEVNVPQGVTRTLSGVISGSGKVVKTGAGTLVLGADTNTFTGGLEITEGTVKANKANSLGSDSSGNAGKGEVHVSDGATLEANGQRLQNTIYLIGNGVNGNGALVNNGGDMGGSIYTTIHLTGDASWGGSGYFHFGANSSVNLHNFTFTKKGTNAFPVRDTTITGPGKIVVAEGQFNNNAGNNTLQNVDLEVLAGATLNMAGSSLSVRDFTCNGTISDTSAILKVNGTFHGGATIPKLELFDGSKIALAQGEAITASNTLTLPAEGTITLDITGYTTLGDYTVITAPNEFDWESNISKVTLNKAIGKDWTMYADGNLLKVKLLKVDADITTSEGYNYEGISVDVDVSHIEEDTEAFIKVVVKDTYGEQVGDPQKVKIDGAGKYQVPFENLTKGAEYSYMVTIVDSNDQSIDGAASDDGKVTLGDVQQGDALFSADATDGTSIVDGGEWAEEYTPTIPEGAYYYEILDETPSIFNVGSSVAAKNRVVLDFAISFEEGFTTEIDPVEDGAQAGVTISNEDDDEAKYWYVCDGGKFTKTTAEATPGSYTVTMEFDYTNEKVRYFVDGDPLTDGEKVWFDNGADSATKIASVSFKGESQLAKFAANEVVIDTNLVAVGDDEYATLAAAIAEKGKDASFKLLTNVSIDTLDIGEYTIDVNDNKFKWAPDTTKYITFKDGKFVVKEITETDKPKNGFTSFDSYVLQLDPEDENSKPYGVAPEDNGDTETLTVEIKGPDGEDLSPRDGYAVKYLAVPTAGEGTKTVISSEPAIDLPLPTSGEVQYSIKIEVIEQ